MRVERLWIVYIGPYGWSWFRVSSAHGREVAEAMNFHDVGAVGVWHEEDRNNWPRVLVIATSKKEAMAKGKKAHTTWCAEQRINGAASIAQIVERI